MFPCGLFSVIQYLLHSDHCLFCEFVFIPSIDSKGALTTFIGVAALAFAQSEAYRIFFKMFSGIIVISMAHGMILSPALLGECMFVWSSSAADEGIKEKQGDVAQSVDEGTTQQSIDSQEITST